MVGTMQGELKPMEYESESEEEDEQEEVDAAGSSGQQGYEETFFFGKLPLSGTSFTSSFQLHLARTYRPLILFIVILITTFYLNFLFLDQFF